jgi:predicted RNA-binding Zn-ribbon protein involved in translation (DUF1610 family)
MACGIIFVGLVLLIWLSSFTKWPYLWAASFFRSCPKCGEVMILDEEQDPGRLRLTKRSSIKIMKNIPRRGKVVYRCAKCSTRRASREWFFS